ncbi:MAG: cytochrome b N-terminal domain-containing protein [Acidimicrobiales bacterium]
MSALTGVDSTLGSIINLTPPGHYIHWGFILISLANLLVIVAMLIVFVLALTMPFVHSRRAHRDRDTNSAHDGAPADGPAMASGAVGSASGAVGSASGAVGSASGAVGHGVPDQDEAGLWTATLRNMWLRYLPPDKMLPDSQPAYVASWIYVFGVLTLMSLTVVIASGTVLALEGPVWWHASSVGLFVNSMHLWSVECFFGFMAIHLWGKFWMASWRGNRQLTWVTGAIAFLVSVFEGFTGYISQTNFDSQWIAFEAKDAMNGAGIGAFFNTMNFGQALMLHVVVMPLLIGLVVVVHIVMVRLRGVAPPIEALPEHLGEPDGPASGIAVSSTARSSLGSSDFSGAGLAVEDAATSGAGS